MKGITPLIIGIIAIVVIAGGFLLVNMPKLSVIGESSLQSSSLIFDPLLTGPISGVGCRFTGGSNVLKSITIKHPDGKVGSLHIETQAIADQVCGGYLPSLKYNIYCLNPGSQIAIVTDGRDLVYDNINIDCNSVVIDATMYAPSYITPNVRVTTTGKLNIIFGLSASGVELVSQTPENFPAEIVNERRVLCDSKYANCVYEASRCDKVEIKSFGGTSIQNCIQESFRKLCKGIIGKGESVSFKCIDYMDGVACNPGQIMPWCTPSYPQLSVKGIGVTTPTCILGQSESRACGNCGTQSRTCLDGLTWSDWSVCSNLGVCAPNIVQSCNIGGIPGQQTCSSSCQWLTCSTTGVCVPGQSQSCGDCGQKICQSNGQFGICQSISTLCQSGYTCQLSLGEYKCTPNPITISANVASQYPYNENIKIDVTTSGLDNGYTITGNIKDENNNLVSQLTGQIFNNKITFTFLPIPTSGVYKFQALITKPYPPYDTLSSDIKLFTIKAPLNVDFALSGGVIQYTTSNAEFRATILTPLGGQIDTNKILTAKVDGFPLYITPQFENQGSGRWLIIIPKEQLAPGRMDVSLYVVDFQNKYEPITKYVNAITVVKPAVSVSVGAPRDAKKDETITITVATQDNTGKPMDVDYLKLTATYPGGTQTKVWEQSAVKNEFAHQNIGSYSVLFSLSFPEGGAYRFRAEAVKSGYDKGASVDVQTVAEGGIVISCDITPSCDASCPDDPDCAEAGFPFLPIIVVGLIGGGALFFVMKKKKKGGR